MRQAVQAWKKQTNILIKRPNRSYPKLLMKDLLTDFRTFRSRILYTKDFNERYRTGEVRFYKHKNAVLPTIFVMAISEVQRRQRDCVR